MKKAFDQTVRDLKREVNKKVLKVPSIEQKILDATSNEPWGPHGSLLADIAHASKNSYEYQMIMTVIWKRINDTGKNWRHVYKGLTVLDYLVAHGSERVIDDIKEHGYQISSLSDFQYIDSKGRDQGNNVRRKSQSLVALVNDKERLAEVREKALANRDKYRSTFSTDGNYRSGGRYDNDRYEGRYGSRDDERYGREREGVYRDDDRYGRYGDRNGRDSEDRYTYRDDDYRGRNRDDDYKFGSRSRSAERDRDRPYDDDDRYSTRENLKKPVGILHVKVVRAMNLQKMDIFGKSDPYVKLILSGDRHWPQHTTVQPKNLNPVWDERFKFIVKDPQTQVLELHVFDWDKMKPPDKIGMQEIPLSILTANETKEFTLNLLKNKNPEDPQNRRNRGRIVVEVKFNPIKDEVVRSGSFSSMLEDVAVISRRSVDDLSSSSGVLSLVVESAEDVEGKHHHNPHVAVLFRGETRKTKKIKNNRNPRWNQRFDYMLEEPPIDEKIHIGVISSKKLSFFPKESLGYIDINLTDVVRNGRINEKFHLIESKNGTIHVEVSWNTVMDEM